MGAADFANNLLHALDPVAFAQEALSFTPDPWQEKVLRWSGKRMLLNCSRQSGKSTTTAVLALHQALFYPGSLTLIVSPSQRQSSELFRKVADFLSLLEEPPELPEDNKLSLTMANRARVVSLPSGEGKIRGFSGASLIIEDEASRVPDELYRAVRPMLAVSGGRLILTSTPWGRRGHFYEEWSQGGPTWERVKITAYDCPRIPREFLEEEKRSMPAPWFASEYECEFTDAAGTVFPSEFVEAAISKELEVW